MAEALRRTGWKIMESFDHRFFTTQPYDLTYSYYLSPNFHRSTKAPTLLLLHGFPDDAFLWAGLLPTLLKLSNPIIIPDLLGFSDSSKPTNPERYRWRQQADSLAQILEAEDVKDNIIPVGHDWGSGIAQRFYLYYRHRCAGLAPTV